MCEMKAWLIDWFVAKGADKADCNDAVNSNYFETGWIDSMQIIELIGDMEEKYDIQFEQTQFQDRRFVTISGLAAILDEMKNLKRKIE